MPVGAMTESTGLAMLSVREFLNSFEVFWSAKVMPYLDARYFELLAVGALNQLP